MLNKCAYIFTILVFSNLLMAQAQDYNIDINALRRAQEHDIASLRLQYIQGETNAPKSLADLQIRQARQL